MSIETESTEFKVGDTVAIVVKGIGPTSISIVKIDKITSTQIVIGSNRFSRITNREIGKSRVRGYWSNSICHLLPLSDPLVKSIRVHNITRRVISMVAQLTVAEEDSIEDCEEMLSRIEIAAIQAWKSIQEI